MLGRWLSLFVTVELADALTTACLVHWGIGQEVWPVTVYMVNIGGWNLAWAFKGLATLGIVLALLGLDKADDEIAKCTAVAATLIASCPLFYLACQLLF